MTQRILSVSNVTKEYRLSYSQDRNSKIVAVDNVSINVDKGDILGIIGESGSGKTTLTKIMLGLLEPTSGEIRLNGDVIGSIDRLKRASSVQMVFQDPFSSLNPMMKIGRIIEQPLIVHRRYDDKMRKQKVAEALELVGLPQHFADSYPRQLSGGQRQRVVIARAIILRPPLIICDEPTSALDVSIQAQILNLLVELRSQLDLTYIIVSHNMPVVRHMATKVAVMYSGKIVGYGPTQDVLRKPVNDYTKKLIDAELQLIR